MAEKQPRQQFKETEGEQLSISPETTYAECVEDLKGTGWDETGENTEGQKTGNCYHPGETRMGSDR